MKKILIIIFAFFHLISLTQNLEGGVIIGINSSQVSGDNLGGFNKFGLKFGGLVKRQMSLFNILVELQYINKGSKEFIESGDYSNGYMFKTSYIEIPFIIEKLINKNIHIQSGFSLSKLLVFSEQIGDYSIDGIGLNKLEYSFHIGLHTKLKRKLYLNTRFSNSIIPIRPHSSGQTYKLNKGQYNTCLSFCIYYMFNKSTN